MAKDTLFAQSLFEKHREKIAFAGPDDCWLWKAGTNGAGYGTVKVRGTMRLAHREAYDATHGECSTDGLVVRHRCDTPRCVNPSHLEIGTRADNVRDMMERGRQAKGEACGMAKLTEDDVRAIRAAYVFGSSVHGQLSLAGRFGVAQTLIGMIVRREIWSHVV